MTITDPTYLAPVAPLTRADVGFATIGTVQPFSARAGIGYQDLLETLRNYIQNDLYTFLTQSNPQTVWDDNVDKLLTAVNGAITEAQNGIDSALEAQRAQVAQNLADTLAQITSGANTDLYDAQIYAGLETANSTALALLDQRYDARYNAKYVPLSSFPVTPEQFGAIGDGVTNDTAAVQQALDTGRPVQLLHQYSVSALTNQGNAPVRGLGWTSKLIARAGTTTLYSCTQIAGQRIRDVWFDGNQAAATCIDTSWTIPNGSAAPSLNNVFDNVRVSGYTAYGWKARSNNDSPFKECLIENVASATAALDMPAAGGMVELTNCKILGPFNLVCQQANIVGGMYFGIIITAADYNLLSVSGGYWYPNSHGTLVWLNSGAQIQAAGVWVGAHIENSINGGALYGGSGAIQGQTYFRNCHIKAIGGVSVAVLQPGTPLGSLNNVNAGIVLEGCFNEGVTVDPAAAPAISVSEQDTTSLGNMRGAGKRTIYVGANSHATLTQLPRAGLILIRANSGASEWAVFGYGRTTDSTGAGTVQQITPVAAVANFAFTIPVGTAQDTNTTDADLYNKLGSAITYELVIIGF